MILGFKQKFKNGKLTNFQNKIMAAAPYFGKDIDPEYLKKLFLSESDGNANIKIHTMRKTRRYEHKMLQLATGVRTRQYHCFLETRCRSEQEVHLHQHDAIIEVVVDGRALGTKEIFALIENDGLTVSEFIDWFFADGDSWSGYIIHFTNFKY